MNKNNQNNPLPPVSVKYYPNSDTYKVQILSENKQKSGIYMWKNLINGKKYIGYSENLRIRFLAKQIF
jgi:hypothetical protein